MKIMDKYKKIKSLYERQIEITDEYRDEIKSLKWQLIDLKLQIKARDSIIQILNSQNDLRKV